MRGEEARFGDVVTWVGTPGQRTDGTVSMVIGLHESMFVLVTVAADEGIPESPDRMEGMVYRSSPQYWKRVDE